MALKAAITDRRVSFILRRQEDAWMKDILWSVLDLEYRSDESVWLCCRKDGCRLLFYVLLSTAISWINLAL